MYFAVLQRLVLHVKAITKACFSLSDNSSILAPSIALLEHVPFKKKNSQIESVAEMKGNQKNQLSRLVQNRFFFMLFWQNKEK